MKRRRQGPPGSVHVPHGPALESIASGQRPYGLDTLPPIGPYLNNTMPLAFATRRVESIPAAHAILTRAASLHPTDSTIQFNLACYEAQLGRLKRAKAHLKRATEIDPKFRLMALEDADLEPLWSSLPKDKA